MAALALLGSALVSGTLFLLCSGICLQGWKFVEGEWLPTFQRSDFLSEVCIVTGLTTGDCNIFYSCVKVLLE